MNIKRSSLRFFLRLMKYGLLSIVMLFVWACQKEPNRQSSSAEANVPDLKAPLRKKREAGAVDIVLVVVDTERADFTSLYGASKPTTPFLASLARQGVVFKNMLSPSPWTAPAMFSMFTGLYPREHGMTKDEKDPSRPPLSLPDQATTLTEYLAAAGYETFGVNTNHIMNPRSGFAQGFDNYLGWHFHYLPFPNLVVETYKPHLHKASKYFLWVHYFDPHQPYMPWSPWFGEWNDTKYGSWMDVLTEFGMKLYQHQAGLPPGTPLPPQDVLRFSNYIRESSVQISAMSTIFKSFRINAPLIPEPVQRFMKAAYMSEIRRTDQAIESAMRSIGIDDQTLLIITSDHGEELFEHGGLGHHRNKLYQELIHVPLVMVLPGRKAAGTVIDTPVSTIDLMPTILEIAGVPIPDDIPGKSLVPLLRGETIPPRPLFSEVNDFKSNTRAIIEYPWKYLYNMGLDYGELYNIESDPHEKNDVNDREPEIRDRMRKTLDDWMEQTKPRWPWVKPLPLSPDDAKRLQQMGYLMQ